MEVSSTEVQNNFGRYLKLAQFEDVIVTKNGKQVAVLSASKERDNASSIAEHAGGYALQNEKVSYEEFIKLTEASEKRYEYIDGEVYLLTSPTFDHQAIIMEIANAFYNYFRNKKCRPLTAPFDITLTVDEKQNVVQPDIVVICDTEHINENGRYTGTPTLVVEVLSESTKKHDLLKKLNLYLHAGIQEYWIVSPLRREVYLYSIAAQDIQDYRVYQVPETISSSVFAELSLPLADIFV